MTSAKNDLKEDFQSLISRLENMILIGALQPRERLVEINLAKKLNVSRAWVRDALKILEARGLVTVIPYRGAMVRELDEQEIKETFEVRAALEKLSNRLACGNFKEQDGQALRQIAGRIRESFNHRNFEAMIAANNGFHNYIRELAGNKTLNNILDQLRGRFYIVNTYAWSSPEIAQRLVAEHDEFIAALESKDLPRLDELAQRHISYSKDLYLRHIQTREAMAGNHSDT